MSNRKPEENHHLRQADRTHKAKKAIQRSRRKTKRVQHYGSLVRGSFKNEKMVNTGMSSRNWKVLIALSNKDFTDVIDEEVDVNDNNQPNN